MAQLPECFLRGQNDDDSTAGAFSSLLHVVFYSKQASFFSVYQNIILLDNDCCSQRVSNTAIVVDYNFLQCVCVKTFHQDDFAV